VPLTFEEGRKFPVGLENARHLCREGGAVKSMHSGGKSSRGKLTALECLWAMREGGGMWFEKRQKPKQRSWRGAGDNRVHAGVAEEAIFEGGAADGYNP